MWLVTAAVESWVSRWIKGSWVPCSARRLADSSAMQLSPVRMSPECEAEPAASRKHSDRSRLESTRELSGSSQSVRILVLVGWQLVPNLLLHVKVGYVELWSRTTIQHEFPVSVQRSSLLMSAHLIQAPAIQLCCPILEGQISNWLPLSAS